MDRIKKYFIRPWDSDAMLCVTPIPRSVSEHLLMVYCTLFYSFIFALSGAISHLLFNNGGWISALGFIGSLWCVSRVKPWREIRRGLFLMTAAFFSGATLGPLINLIIEMDQSNIIKIFMGGLLFFASYLGATIHSLERSVIYQLSEYSAPIIIATWMVISDTYPGLLTHTVCLLTLPFQWYTVVRAGSIMWRKLKTWLNTPVHIVWILVICYGYDHSIRDLMYVYAILLWVSVHMNLYNQLAIHRAIHNTDENYYVSTTITFFTEFPVHIIDLLIHPVDVIIMVLNIRKRAPAPGPRTGRSRAART